jgi:hypothetical protein
MLQHACEHIHVIHKTNKLGAHCITGLKIIKKKFFFFCTVTSKNLFISLSPKNLHDQKILQSLQLAGIKKIPAVKLQVQMR